MMGEPEWRVAVITKKEECVVSWFTLSLWMEDGTTPATILNKEGQQDRHPISYSTLGNVWPSLKLLVCISVGGQYIHINTPAK